MNKAAFSFGALISIFVALSPLAVWQAFLGDPLYDSLFGPSFGSLPVLKAGRVMPVRGQGVKLNQCKTEEGKSVPHLGLRTFLLRYQLDTCWRKRCRGARYV